MKRAVYMDLETAGLEFDRPDIQLAAVAVDETTGAEIETFERKIAFDPLTADPKALELNHYSAEAWEKAVEPVLVVHQFAAFLNRHKSLQMVSKRGNPYSVAKLVGHYAATFDGPRLQRLFQKHEAFLPADPRVRCTVQRALWWFDEHRATPPENYQLATLCRYFGVEVVESHEALTDVRLTIALARAIAGRHTKPVEAHA